MVSKLNGDDIKGIVLETLIELGFQLEDLSGLTFNSVIVKESVESYTKVENPVIPQEP